MFDFAPALERFIDKGASDLHLKVGNRPLIRVDGKLRWLDPDIDPLRPLPNAPGPDISSDPPGEPAAVLEPALLSHVLRLDAGSERSLGATFDAEARAGIERVNAAIASSDAAALRREAHELRGVAAAIGARRLQNVSERLDRVSLRDAAAVAALQEELAAVYELTRTALEGQARTA